MECSDNFIPIEIKGKPYSITNCWEALSPDQFIYITGLLRQFAAGQLSMSEVRLRYIIYTLDIDMSYIPPKHADAIAQNLYVLLSRVTFIFNIRYPDDVWNNISPELRVRASKTDPFSLPDSPEVRILRRQEYTYTVDACFARQLIPSVTIGEDTYKGYTVRTDCDELSSSLTARQYIDAVERLSAVDRKPELLALLAAILYCPGHYDNDWAHAHACDFATLPRDVLEAIALNFQAFVILLFRKTHFSILRSKNAGTNPVRSKLSVGMADGLYNLSIDGYGDLNTVNRLSLIEYLGIMRKKLIDSVRTMHEAKMSVADIIIKTGLDAKTINDII